MSSLVSPVHSTGLSKGHAALTLVDPLISCHSVLLSEGLTKNY